MKFYSNDRIIHFSKFLTRVNWYSIKFVGVEIDKHMNWKMHIKLILPKLSSASYAIKCMTHNSIIATLKMLYHAYCLSVVMYGTIFWGNSTDINKGFYLQKKFIRLMMGISSKAHVHHFYKTERIWPILHAVHIVMKCLVNNLEYIVLFNNRVHTKFTRNRISSCATKKLVIVSKKC
jgi:hypothetical protein